MNLVFDIETSIEFWRQRYPLNRTPKPACAQTPQNCAYRKRDILSLIPDWVDQTFLKPLGGVFHALVLDHAKSRQLDGVSIHSWSGTIPAGSFYELQPGVFIESPAFMFLHAGQLLDLPTLIAFGDELCGLYSFDAREIRGFRKRSRPLVSKSELTCYLQQAAGCKGQKRCMQALPHIVGNSASPMESFDEMTMCLPYRLGGYCILRPTMNLEVPLERRAARIAKRQKCYLDMGYEDLMLDIEHHGKLDHSSDDEKESDRARVNGLKEMGFEVVELTGDQVADLIAYEYIIQRIAAFMGKRLKPEKLGYTQERIALRRALYRWNESFGRIR